MKTDYTMSHLCPLCGKEKKEEALFCNACTKKLRSEYEVDLPQEVQHHHSPVEERQSDGYYLHQDNGEAEEKRNSNSKTGRRLGRIAITLLLLMITFFLYNGLIRKGNLERSGWDAATKANSVAGYLHYIENHPDGAHFDDAQAALMQLKVDEADRWEVLKKSDRVTELRDFLLLFPESHYVPLVKRRLDSLTWMGVLHSNTSAAYSDYMMMAESGDFNGDYLAEAETRYRMLFQSYPVDQPTLDSIRIVVNGFYSALNSLDHAGLEQWLAPRVQRFFFKGPKVRERLLGELLVDAARSEEPTITYIPDLGGVQYEKTLEDICRVNLPILKSRNNEGILEQLPGYIMHLELNTYYQIISVHETKPHPGAP